MSFRNVLSSYIQPIREWYSEINSATLTGAIDVIVVEQEDGTFLSSPFHVRFGKLGVLKAKEKIVDIEVNNEPVNIHMKLDDNGTAFFVEGFDDGDEDVPPELATSPLPNISESTPLWTEEEREAVNRSLVNEFDKTSTSGDTSEVDNASAAPALGKIKFSKAKKKRKSRHRHSRNGSRSSLSEVMATQPATEKVQADVGQCSEAAEHSLLLSRLPEPDQLTSLVVEDESDEVEPETSKKTSTGSLPIAMERKLQYFSEPEISPGTSPLGSRPASPIMSDTEFEVRNQSRPGQSDEEQSWEWGKMPVTSSAQKPSETRSTGQRSPQTSEDLKNKEEKAKSWVSWFRGSQKNARLDSIDEAPGVYLDDLKGDDEEMIKIYVGRHRSGASMSRDVDNEDAESGNGPSLPVSPHSVEGAIGYVHSSNDHSWPLGNVDVAFCGGVDFTPALFEETKVSFDEFVVSLEERPNLLSDPNLVVRIDDVFYKWAEAAPIIMSCVLYNRTLPSSLIDKLTNTKSSSATRKSSWWPFGSRIEKEADEKKASSVDQPAEAAINSDDTKQADAPPTASSSDAESDPELKSIREKYKKSLRLTNESIGQLNLKPGANVVQFSVTTAFQGTTRCCCHIYLWKSTDKIVISDIDGTITKSDVLGHVLPIIGRDWAQSGVASLFTKIADNGYRIVYLSARAIGQASITKDYLASIKQGEVNLPDGPMFLNPTSLVNAFHREVIEKKPEEFKIACLRDIQKLFPESCNPFYAGYGNRVNDVWAYRAVGIPISRIFTINPKGELRHELTQTFQTSYGSMSDIVDMVYPSIEANDSPSVALNYSSFTFWREPIPKLESEINIEE